MSVYNELLHRCIIIYTSICMYIMCICIDAYTSTSVYTYMYILPSITVIVSNPPRCGGPTGQDLVVRGHPGIYLYIMSDRVLVRGSVRGRVLVRGQTVYWSGTL